MLYCTLTLCIFAHCKVAPGKFGLLPLVKKPPHCEVANDLYQQLSALNQSVDIALTGSIGKRSVHFSTLHDQSYLMEDLLTCLFSMPLFYFLPLALSGIENLTKLERRTA